MLHPSNNLAILGLSRSGTTIVGQTLAIDLHKRFSNVYPHYQGELSHVFLDYFFINEDQKVKEYQEGAYIKSYRIKDNYLQKQKIYKNITLDEEAAKVEMNLRMDLLNQMIDSKFKTIIKIHPYSIWCDFQYPYVIDTLSKLNYIHVKRNNKLEHFLSLVISLETGIYHTNNPNEIIATDIEVTKYHMIQFDEYLIAEKWFLEHVNVVKTVIYEELGNIEQEGCVKKMPYSMPKIEYIKNKDEVLEYAKCLK